MVTVLSVAPEQTRARRLLLDTEAVENLTDLAGKAESTEDQLRFLVEFHSEQLAALADGTGEGSFLSFFSSLGWPEIFVGLPGMIILAAAIYLFVRCYPGSVFNWGDYAEHYQGLVDRRRFLWSTIVVAFAVCQPITEYRSYAQVNRFEVFFFLRGLPASASPDCIDGLGLIVGRKFSPDNWSNGMGRTVKFCPPCSSIITIGVANRVLIRSFFTGSVT